MRDLLSTWTISGVIILILLFSGVVICLILLMKQKKKAKERAQFFTNTAHDIRTPLTLIKAPLEEVISSQQLTEEGLRQLNMALMNVHAILRLTTNLINLGHVDIYSSQLFVSEYKLSPYAEEICNSFRVYAGIKHIQLNYECHCEYLHVWFDRDKMDSILRNLLSNALKFTPDGGRVAMCVDESNEMWFVEVKDTGIGIPDSEQKYMFRFSFRASNALNSKVPGSGVGLMLVHKLVCLHKGKIYVSSVLQKGTTVKIEFPKGKRHFRKAHLVERQQTDVILRMSHLDPLAMSNYRPPADANAVSRGHHGKTVEMNEADQKFLATVNANIDKNMMNPEFNVDVLCSSVNMCRTNFYHKLKALTGCSPSEHIRNMRLNHAVELLEEGSHNVTEVAWMCGFNNVKYFREVFKKQFKVCPSRHVKEKMMVR